MIIEGDRGETRIAESIALNISKVLGPILGPRFRVNPASTIARAAMDAVVKPKQGIHFVYSPELTTRS
jgi:hypothetical protein